MFLDMCSLSIGRSSQTWRPNIPPCRPEFWKFRNISTFDWNQPHRKCWTPNYSIICLQYSSRWSNESSTRQDRRGKMGLNAIKYICVYFYSGSLLPAIASGRDVTNCWYICYRILQERNGLLPHLLSRFVGTSLSAATPAIAFGWDFTVSCYTCHCILQVFHGPLQPVP